MLSLIRPALTLLVAFTVSLGALYPALITAIAQVAFPSEANGSLIRRGDGVVGSRLIGQPFDDAKYFRSRPSAAGPVGYDAAASAGSNLGPCNPALLEAVGTRAKAVAAADGVASSIPVDLVTTSGSGLDPHISVAAADTQVGRVARARGMSEAEVRWVMAKHTEGRTFGVLGNARVNVLLLNLALDGGPSR
ncbi:MAG: potassium-transporting ATPase subunit KdpC [Deltaproteobacteria bacterium]|nr:potassium-transporting ATPase subunit KdpC [Deltaproteobacteria bacterium]